MLRDLQREHHAYPDVGGVVGHGGSADDAQSTAYHWSLTEAGGATRGRMMAKGSAMIEVRDVVLWPQHVRGAPALRDRLLALDAEAVVHLRVDGRVTTWSRMKDGKDGRPASGLRPC